MSTRRPRYPNVRHYLCALIGFIAIAAGVCSARMWMASSLSSGDYHYISGDDRPPNDPRYLAAMKRGRSGDLSGAQLVLIRLEAQVHGSSAGAWALYEAGIAARSLHNPVQQRRLWNRLAVDYPAHPLAMRVRDSPEEAHRQVSDADCGPRALAHLLERAGKHVAVVSLARECGTDARGTTLEALQNAAKKEGIRAEAYHVDRELLEREHPRGIAWVDGIHYVYFEPAGWWSDSARVWDPNGPAIREMKWKTLGERSQGIVLLAAWGRQALPAL